MIRGLEFLSYEKSGEIQLGKEKAPRRFHRTLQYLKGACNKAREQCVQECVETGQAGVD